MFYLIAIITDTIHVHKKMNTSVRLMSPHLISYITFYISFELPPPLCLHHTLITQHIKLIMKFVLIRCVNIVLSL